MKIKFNNGLFNIKHAIIIKNDNNPVIKISCLADSRAFFLESCPINCAVTTAPPVPNAAKIFINKILMVSTNETAETAVSPIFETIIVSANPTVTANSCSIIKGIINFFRFLFEKRLFTSTILSIKFNYSKVFFPFDIFKLNNSWFV